MVASFYKHRSKATKFGSKKKKTFRKRGNARKKTKMTPTAVKSIVSREINKDLETKLKPITPVYAGVPSNADTSLNCVYYNNYCLGAPAPTWLGPSGSANFVGVDGVSFAQGTGPQQRIGRYMTLKYTSLNFRVGLVGVPRQSSQTRFRVLVYKAKRNAQFGTSGSNPNETLFLNTNGNQYGINNTQTLSSQAYNLMNAITNKRNFDIHMDTQFVLGHPTVSVSGSASIVTPLSQSLPDEKNFLIKLPHNDLNTAYGAGNLPEDLNYQYCITVLSCPTGNLENTGYNSWRTYLRGVTSVKDA